MPTRRHAEMLFDMVADHLGPEALLETWNGGTTRTLFRREAPNSEWLLPWPLLSVTRGGREGPSPVMTAVPGVYEEPKPRPGPAPRLRDLGPGRIAVHDGPHEITVSYGADGRWFECTRSQSPEALAGAAAALRSKGGPPAELLAGFLSALDLARHGPGRVRMPVPLPQGVAGAWATGLRTLRDGAFRERPARADQWLATDGWTGMTLTADLTREGAVRSLDGKVRRERPFPRKPEPSTEPPTEPPPEPFLDQTREENGFSIRASLRGPESDSPSVEPTPENTPVVVVRTGQVPERALPAGWHWAWLFGACGNPCPVAMLWQPKGITVVGDRLLEVLAMDRLEDLLAEADRAAPPRPATPPGFARSGTPVDNRCRFYRLADEKTGAPVRPAVIHSSWGGGFHAGNVDGDLHRWIVLRQRILPG